MSVASELTKLADNMNDAYDAVEAKGGTVPQTKTMSGLATAIGTISGGGGGAAPSFCSFYRSPVGASLSDLSWLDTSNITSMTYMFAYSRPTKVDLSHFDVSSCEDFSYMFYNNCATALDLSTFRLSNTANMSAMFSNARALKLFIPKGFRATGGAVSNAFSAGPYNEDTYIFTEMTQAEWNDCNFGTVNSDYIVLYEKTHADYEAV